MHPIWCLSTELVSSPRSHFLFSPRFGLLVLVPADQGGLFILNEMSLGHLESGPGACIAESLGRRKAVCQALQLGQEPLTSDLEEPRQGKVFVPCFHPFPRALIGNSELPFAQGS